jgi:hypothetical protein
VATVRVDPRFERAVLAELATEEVAPVDLLSGARNVSPQSSILSRARTLSKAPGRPGYLARVVARVSIEDLLDGDRPEGETLAALALLPDPRLMT